MLRKDLIEGAEMLCSAIGSSGVHKALHHVRRTPDGKYDKLMIINTYKEYLLAIDKFSKAAQQIERILGLEFLRDSAFWLTMLSDVSESKVKFSIDKFQTVTFTLEYLPRLISLLGRESDVVGKCKESTEKPGYDKIIVNVIEDKYVSTPERLILMLESITELYVAVSTVYSLKPSDLCVASCDSGSDKSFDFIGVAQGITAVKEIILGVWDRIAFHQESRAKQQLEVIALALPIMETITKMETDGSLQRETAEIVRRQICGGLFKFREAGITIPEIDQRTTLNPRQILAPERKLLVGPSFQKGIDQEEDYCSEVSSNSEEEDVSIEDEELKKLLEKVANDHIRKRKKKAPLDPELDS